MQFKLNDMVMHCREGLATITSITKMGDREYFIVHAAHGDGDTIYVPMATAENIIRPIMDKVQAESLVGEMKLIEKDFNTNTKQRRDAFKRRLISGDVRDLAYLYMQNMHYECDPEGVRLGPADVEMLTFASSTLLDEFSLSFRIERERVDGFIKEKLKK